MLCTGTRNHKAVIPVCLSKSILSNYFINLQWNTYKTLHSCREQNDLFNRHSKAARALFIHGVGYLMANNVFAVFLLIFSYNIYPDARHWHQCK